MISQVTVVGQTPSRAEIVNERRTSRRSTADGAAVATNSKELVEVLSHRLDCKAKRLGELLRDAGLITQQQLNDALAEQRRSGGVRLGVVLERLGVTTAEAVHRTLAVKFGLPFVRLRSFDYDPRLLAHIPRELAVKYKAFPLMTYNGHLVVAMEDPMDQSGAEAVRFVSGCNLEVVVSTAEDIEEAVKRYYGITDGEQALEQLRVGTAEEELDVHADDAEQLSKLKPLVRLVDNILDDAIRKRSSDIHIRPTKAEAELLYRVDGELRSIRKYSKNLLPAIASRLKVIGGMDISERRLPQDGRAHFGVDELNVDLRISIVPTVKGESIVIRVLNPMVGLKRLDALGFSDRDGPAIRKLLRQGGGLFLVTGPTGSGKTTTQYAAMNELLFDRQKIVSVEDPVEYPIDGIEQIQVQAANGYTFPKALRHILRHDPDAIVIGEIRDRETAQIAMESAMTGHIVLSTLHTNSASATVFRLLEMGIESYLVNSTLSGVLAQRLVRRNCPHCASEEEVSEATRAAMGIVADETFISGKGCEECDGTGYCGRLAVYELLLMSPAMRDTLSREATLDTIRQQAVADGMVSLTACALAAARRGETSVSEVHRIRFG